MISFSRSLRVDVQRNAGIGLMNTTGLVEHLATDNGVSKEHAKKIVDGVFLTIAAAAIRGEEVSLNGFGRFKVVERAERQGRNPATGETITIAATKKLAFTPAKAVRDALNAPAADRDVVAA